MVVCAYTQERWDDLHAAYEALLHQSRVPDGIVLVVDHSPDLLDRARRTFPAARVIPNTGPRGLSGARNTGIAASEAELLLFLDDDATPEKQWVERLVAPFADSSVVGVGGWATAVWDAPGRPAWFPEPFLWVVGCSYEGLPREPAKVRNPIGCGMAFRRTAVLDAGGFTSDLGRLGRHPVGCEETELAIRVQRRTPGVHIAHEPRAVVHHRVTAARRSPSYFVRRCYWEGYSKAVVAASVGAGDALAAERSYTTRTLPVAFLRGVAEAIRGRPAGLARSTAVVAGLLVTAAGYARGRVTLRTPRAGGRRSAAPPRSRTAGSVGGAR